MQIIWHNTDKQRYDDLSSGNSLSRLSFVGATTGRLWHRLINYYAQGDKTDVFSERLVIVFYNLSLMLSSFSLVSYITICREKKETTIAVLQSLDYDDNEDDVSDNEYEMEKIEQNQTQSAKSSTDLNSLSFNRKE